MDSKTPIQPTDKAVSGRGAGLVRPGITDPSVKRWLLCAYACSQAASLCNILPCRQSSRGSDSSHHANAVKRQTHFQKLSFEDKDERQVMDVEH